MSRMSPSSSGSAFPSGVVEGLWLSGDGVGGLDVALEKAKDFMDYVQVRHEEWRHSWRLGTPNSPVSPVCATRRRALAQFIF